MARTDWRFGMNGIRYDEECSSCGELGDIDNDTSCCPRCHAQSVADTAQLRAAASPEMRRLTKHYEDGAREQ